MTSQSKSIDALDLRRAFGAFATGVTIVTCKGNNGEVYGFTANSFSSVSLDPPLLLVSIAKTAYALETFTQAEGFAVNLLSENQRDLSNTFASRGADKFANVTWSERITGAPLFDGVIAWFDCNMFEQVDAGDHVILIGRVMDYEYNTDSPLAFCRGAYVSFGLSPKMLQLVSAGGDLRVGALIEHEDRVLLQIDPDNGVVRLPLANSVGDIGNPDSLIGLLYRMGIEAHLPFIYAAYHHENTRYVYYRGGLKSIAEVEETARMHFVEFDDIPWDAIEDKAVTSMLTRFLNEHAIDSYAVYLGDLESGDVYPANN